MLIEEMSRQESMALLSRRRLGRLACAREGQPYVTPIYFAPDGDCLYSFSTLGRKIEWMRANPLVCVEAEEIESPQKWATIIVLGRYEELANSEEHESIRQFAYALLQQQPLWWQPGYVKTILHGQPRSLDPVYFRIHIANISGHRATPDG